MLVLTLYWVIIVAAFRIKKFWKYCKHNIRLKLEKLKTYWGWPKENAMPVKKVFIKIELSYEIYFCMIDCRHHIVCQVFVRICEQLRLICGRIQIFLIFSTFDHNNRYWVLFLHSGIRRISWNVRTKLRIYYCDQM